MTSLKRGWCPTLDRPMASGDGLLVRVQPRRATLTPGQAHALAEAAARHGNGLLELTGRGNIQLRGLREAFVAPFAAAMDAAALPSPGPLLPPPLLGADPAIDPRTEALLLALEHALLTDPRFQRLPAKFAIGIDGGGLLGGRPVAATLVAHPDGRLRPADHADAPPLAGPLSTRPGAPYALCPPFAQFTVPMLHALADLAQAHATTVRTTPWRAFVLARTIGPVQAGPAWITDPDDPRLRVTTCVGAPGCLRGTTPTRAHADRLAAALRPGTRVHLSGCAKGCAHPAPAPLTLVARNGLYDLVRGGRPADPPDATALTLEVLLSHA